MARVIVCGGRAYADAEHVARVLDELHAARGIDVLAEGGAGRWGVKRAVVTALIALALITTASLNVIIDALGDYRCVATGICQGLLAIVVIIRHPWLVGLKDEGAP